MITSRSSLSLRTDLIRRRVWMGNRSVWVIKDPLSRSFFYFNDQEHEILRLADGTRSLSEIASECCQRFAPQYISAESLVRFFADARSKGLVIVAGAGLHRGEDQLNSRRRWWHNPLAIRLPGLNPDRFLDAMVPYLRPVFSPITLAVVLLLMLAATAIAARDFSALTQHLSTAATRFGAGSSLVILVIVISLTKIVHELAHAFACKYFGGECRELGLMFLVGVPCLYCDVSDAWMLDYRWKRILISAAGMLAELTLAAIATFVWFLTVDGPVRDLCVTVMFVCSVTTVLFNGNPLLRYDGYYILSDLVGIPNLAGEATALIRGWMRRLLWATPASHQPSADVRRNAFIVTYGITSGVYRVVVYLLILWMLYRIADHYEQGGLAGMLGLIAIGCLMLSWARSVLTPPDGSVGRARTSTRRPASIVTAFLIAALCIGLLPLPRRVVAPMSIQPADAQPIYVSSEGAIAGAVGDGANVTEGQLVASLSNPRIDRELLAIRCQCQRLTAELKSLRQRRGSDRRISSRIPTVEKALEESVKQQQLRANVADRLLLRSPRSGRIFSPPRHVPATTDDRQPQTWIGTPLETRNRGAWLREGTELCIVGDQRQREAIVLLRQQDVELIRRDQPVTLLLTDRNRGAVRGRVLEVAASPVREIPRELQRRGFIDPSNSLSPKTPYYQVRVSLDSTALTLPVRLTGHARIAVSNASVLARIARFLSDSFG